MLSFALWGGYIHIHTHIYCTQYTGHCTYPVHMYIYSGHQVQIYFYLLRACLQGPLVQPSNDKARTLEQIIKLYTWRSDRRADGWTDRQTDR